jgi:vancomycin resistance protein YoaR
MFNGESTAEIYFDRKEPKITLEKINNLGINTLIGRGESDFSGSPASRIHNIKVGIGKFNGTIVGPGEEFSFNSLLGEVDEKNGYQPELVIKEGKLIYEYGGGLCQVSTTIFRSAILSGLPILERKPHSFPVRYYNPQGFDSTVYPGVVDLRFKNDTPSHILIQGKVDKTKLVVEIYGSSDGRDISIEGPYQYDQQSNGAMKAYFIRKIASNGETKEERFNSSYRPPPTSKEERNPLE